MENKLRAEPSLNFIKPKYTSVGLYELSYNENNVRKLSKVGFGRLKKKILENVYEPLKVWKQGNVVLSGNQRLSVMRFLAENEGYTIDKINVAIYDVDARTAKFIELSDNEHEGQYDLDKLVEEIDTISDFDLKDILDPKLIKKIETKITPAEEDIDFGDLDDTNLELIETNSTDIIISNVPKIEGVMFYDTIDSICKVLGVTNQWDALKVILLSAKDLDVDELMEYQSRLKSKKK